MKKAKIVLTGSLMALLVTLSIFTSKNDQNEIYTNAEADLANQKIEWGIKRNDNNNQPDLGTKNKELIEKYDGIAIGTNQEKNIYLTFDSGYEAGYTEKILDVLKEKGVQGTFFITAHYLNTASELVKRMIDEGHIVGNHTVNHKSMPSLTDEEIKEEVMKLNQLLYEKFEYEMKYIRPPKGEFSERTLKITQNLGFKTVMWSFAYVDWNEDSQPKPEEAISKIKSNFHNGEVMLLHSTSKTNSEIMGQIIDEARKDGYEFKSLDDFHLWHCDSVTLVPVLFVTVTKRTGTNVTMSQEGESMKKNKRLNDILEIPKEIYSNTPNLIITGFEDMVIENYKGIIEYEDYYVRVSTFIGIVNIHVINLK